MQSIECFLIEPTNRHWKALRRFAFHTTPACTGGFHNAEVVIDEVDEANPMCAPPTDAERTDPRWPLKCDRCDYMFTDEDRWEVEFDRQYITTDGRQFSRRTPEWPMTGRPRAPAGAMWRADWLEDTCVGPDGCCYVVRTPGGDWILDYKVRPEDAGWTRTGVAPKFTVRPSILIGSARNGSWKYHGFLTDGRLEEC